MERLSTPIGLALSGGGFRATAFHYGVLLELHALGILENVKWISSASGGTLLSGLYAAHRAGRRTQAHPDEDWFDGFRTSVDDLLNRNVVSEAAARAGPETSLICAAAHIYGDLVGDCTLGDLENAEREMPAFAFVTTEMRYGLRFPFFACLDATHDGLLLGNKHLRVDAATLNRVFVRDAMAASSCFPGGFAPMMFPDDFGRLDDARFVQADERAVGLMDGGILDNLGTRELIRISKPESDTPPPLFIVSDVDRALGTKKRSLSVQALLRRGFWRPRKRTPPRAMGRRTLGELRSALYFFCALLFVVAVLFAWSGHTLWKAGASNAALGIAFAGSSLSGVIALAFTALVLVLQTKLRRASADYEAEIGFNARAFLKNKTVSFLLSFVADRATSTLALTSGIFMKRIRNFRYRELFADGVPRAVVANIYALLNPPKDSSTPEPTAPSGKVLKVVGRAWTMPTTLWFERRSEPEDVLGVNDRAASKNDLVTAGRVTLIQALRKEALKPHGHQAVVEMTEQLETRWRVLMNEP